MVFKLCIFNALSGFTERNNLVLFSCVNKCIIVIMNSWELLLKAIISKNRGSIYYRKKRNEPYRTMSMTDAFTKAEKFFPKKIPTLPLRANLSLLSTYRV